MSEIDDVKQDTKTTLEVLSDLQTVIRQQDDTLAKLCKTLNRTMSNQNNLNRRLKVLEDKLQKKEH